MDKAKKKNIKRLIGAICVVVFVAVLALMPVIAKQERRQSGPQASILTAKVQLETIQTEIVGGGVLAGEDPETLTVPSAVKLTGYLAINGDTVKAGDPIANVDRVSVMKAITQVQDTLDHLAEQIQKEGKKDTDETVKALSGGTVKHMYAKKGDSVQAVMLEHGALAVLSLDGLMAVKLTVESDLLAGQKVSVTLENGKTVTGKVKSNLAGEMIVTVTDKDYEDGQTVQVSNGETALGSGQLYILSPWKATAYAGTVSSVSVKEGAEAKVGQNLMKLKNTGKTAVYHQLVSMRQEYEELLLELFQMYQTQQITAPCDGMVNGLDKDSLQLLSADGNYTLELLANAPNGDDLTQYVNYVGKVTGVGQNGWTLLVNPQTLQVPDYLNLTGVPLEETAMTQATVFEVAVPVYERLENAWQQIDQLTVTAGDILLFAFDSQGQPVWTVRVQKASQQLPADPQQPSNPGGNTGESTGGNAGDSTGGNAGGNTQTNPGGNTGTRPGGSAPSGSMPSGGNIGGGNWGGAPQQEETFELYGLETAQIAQVTPQTQVTLEVAIDEMDVVKLSVGMAAQVKVDALGGEKCEAHITDISNTGTNDGGQSKYAVTLSMNRLENMLSGMNATAVIPLETGEQMLTVPVAALVEQGNKTFVYTGYDEKEEAFTGAVEVTLGVTDGDNVQILSGLQEGQVCYYAYYDTPVISDAPQSGSAGFGGFGGPGGMGGMSGFPGR